MKEMHIDAENGNNTNFSFQDFFFTLESALLEVPFATGKQLNSIDETARRIFFMIEGSAGFLAFMYAISHGFKGVVAYSAVPFADFLVRSSGEFSEKGLHAGQRYDYSSPGIIGYAREAIEYIKRLFN